MGWYCCSCCINKNWSFNKISCIECRHIRCRNCAMTTDNIGTQTYNLRLRSSWEADENYDFNRFHTPDCKQNECDGSCGLKDKKELREQIKLRRDKEKQRLKMDEQDKEDKKLKLAEKEDSTRKESTATTSSGTGAEVGEPGDTDFVTGVKIRGKASGNSTPKGRKKGRVTFAEEDVKMSG